MKTTRRFALIAFGLALADYACATSSPTAPSVVPAADVDAAISPVDARAATADDAATSAPIIVADAANDPSREPQTIAIGLDHVDAIALDDADVYVLSKLPSVWRLSRVAKRGGAVSRLDDFHAEAVSLAVDDRNFYVATALKISEAIQGGNFRTSAYGRVIAASKVGGSRATIVDGLRAAYGVAVFGSSVFWLSAVVDFTGVWNVDAVMRGRTSGGGATFVAMKQSGATSVAADDANVFFTVAGRFDEKKRAWPAGAVMRAPASGATASTLVVTGDQPHAITLDDGAVYWLERDGALMRIAKAGGASSLVVDHVEHFALDSARVYSSNGAAIGVTAKSGGDTSARWNAPSPVTAIAVDAAFVYYAAGGELRRAPK